MKLWKQIPIAMISGGVLFTPVSRAAGDYDEIQPKQCYVDVAELVSMIKAYSPAQEHYHKVKGLYTWQAPTKAKIDLSGSGKVVVQCD